MPATTCRALRSIPRLKLESSTERTRSTSSRPLLPATSCAFRVRGESGRSVLHCVNGVWLDQLNPTVALCPALGSAASRKSAPFHRPGSRCRCPVWLDDQPDRGDRLAGPVRCGTPLPSGPLIAHWTGFRLDRQVPVKDRAQAASAYLSQRLTRNQDGSRPGPLGTTR